MDDETKTLVHWQWTKLIQRADREWNTVAGLAMYYETIAFIYLQGIR